MNNNNNNPQTSKPNLMILAIPDVDLITYNSPCDSDVESRRKYIVDNGRIKLNKLEEEMILEINEGWKVADENEVECRKRMDCEFEEYKIFCVSFKVCVCKYCGLVYGGRRKKSVCCGCNYINRDYRMNRNRREWIHGRFSYNKFKVQCELIKRWRVCIKCSMPVERGSTQAGQCSGCANKYQVEMRLVRKIIPRSQLKNMRCKMCLSSVKLQVHHIHGQTSEATALCGRCNRAMSCYNDDPWKMLTAAARMIGGRIEKAVFSIVSRFS